MVDDYKDIGKLLKEERQKRNKSLEDISEETKVSVSYLEAIENGDISIFPSRIYYNMFARSYARDFDLDTDELFGIETQPILPVEDSENGQKTIDAGNKKEITKNNDSSILKIVLWLIAIVAVIFIVIVIASSLGDDASDDPGEDIAPAFAEVSETEQDAASQDIIDSTQFGALSQQELIPAPSLPPIRMNILVFDSCWIYVKADSDTVLNRNLVTGNSRSLSADSVFIISMGNPGGVELRINDTLVGPLSNRNRPVMEYEINRDNYNELFVQPEDSVVVTP